ncbi:hypothetical protein SXCC_00039 [Gluconacetobacter sp. SXCC-1]|nr:hypothetical protein SXCC_00039 [Gluconacetobacter sp. SXCC-1]
MLICPYDVYLSFFDYPLSKCPKFFESFLTAAFREIKQSEPLSTWHVNIFKLRKLNWAYISDFN